jgi:hypothetical protein
VIAAFDSFFDCRTFDQLVEAGDLKGATKHADKTCRSSDGGT